MSSDQPGPGTASRSETEATRYGAHAGQWRDIGITAVAAAAAAARLASDAKPVAQKSSGEPNKVVTLRDIDHLAA
ncbi:hypothetical protein V5F77_11510 [Xanthobacter sp. DSM 24535]|uniref:hypothetical protein n=1 Tax=Roseixanthobacter psychrophilus TaxID=3119917 RepID=UPI00372ABCCE